MRARIRRGKAGGFTELFFRLGGFTLRQKEHAEMEMSGRGIRLKIENSLKLLGGFPGIFLFGEERAVFIVEIRAVRSELNGLFILRYGFFLLVGRGKCAAEGAV